MTNHQNRKMHSITLKNTFHNTSISVRSNEKSASEAWFEIQAAAQNPSNTAARAKLRRIERALCGFAGCACGTVRS